MALPNAPTEGGGSKMHFGVWDNASTNAQAVIRAIAEETINSEVQAHMAVATHAEDETYSAGDPVILLAGLNGTNIVPVAVDSSGHLQVDDAGSFAVTQSGSWNVGQSGSWNVGLNAGTNNIGDVDILTIAAGTTTIGAILDGGWDQAGKAVQRGLLDSITATSEQVLLTADAGNLYNIYTLSFTVYSGSTAPATVRQLEFKLGAAGTVFHREYIPPTANQVISRSIDYRLPVRSATNQAIVVQLSGALGTGGEYSSIVLAYKSAT